MGLFKNLGTIIRSFYDTDHELPYKMVVGFGYLLIKN